MPQALDELRAFGADWKTLFTSSQTLGLARENIISPPRCRARQHAVPREHRRTLLLSSRTTTVNVHRVSSGRNCRETIASLRNARATRYHVTNFLCRVSRQWLRWQRYHILARIISECRYAEREGEDPNCKSDRPAAPATQSGSFSHARIVNPLRI
jgi:hypothetical protein